MWRPVDLHNPGCASKESACDRCGTTFAGGGQFDEFCKIRREGLAGLGDVQPEVLRKTRSVDNIDLFAAGLA